MNRRVSFLSTTINGGESVEWREERQKMEGNKEYERSVDDEYISKM